MAIYDNYLKMYGAQGYADLIRKKEAAGQALDNPAAAAAFKQNYSSLFSQPSSNVGSSTANSLVGIRNYLTQQGYTNPEIGWNQAEKTVYLGGRPLISPTTITEGRSYAPLSALQAALNRYKSTDYGTQAAELLSQLRKPQQFTYDLSSDPQYQAAKEQIEADTKQLVEQLSNTAMERLNARGLLKSTITGDTLSQIGEEQARQASSNLASIIPGLYQNALTQYNQQIQNQYNLLNALTALQSAQQSAISSAQEQEAESALAQYNQAMDRWKAAGTVSAQDAAILGVPAGTPTSDYLYKQAQTEIDRLNAQANLTRAGRSGGSAASTKNQILAQEQAGLDIWLQNNLPPADQYTAENVQSVLQQAEAFIRNNAAYYTSMGIDPEDLVDYVYRKVTGKSASSSSSNYQKALSYAQKDTRWDTADATEKRAIIQEYIDLLG